MKTLILGAVLLLSFSVLLEAEPAQPAQPDPNAASGAAGAAAAGAPRAMVILPTSDTSGLNLATPLQYALVSLYQQDNRFAVQISTFALSGFSAQEIANAHQTLNSQLLSFSYLEPDRISLFLFDLSHPKEFIVSSQALNDQTTGQALNAQYVEYKFRIAYNQLIAAFNQGLFQPLPGTETGKEVAGEEMDDSKRKVEEAKRLYRELAAQEEKKYYVGASVGMARFSNDGTSGSNVSFGGFVGTRFAERTRIELGIDIFSYAMLHAEGRYVLPIAERLVSLQASIGVAKILGSGFGNAEFDTTQLNPGGVLFGPGLSFDIPLLGSSLRGDLRFYVGSGSIFMGTYGIAYSI